MARKVRWAAAHVYLHAPGNLERRPSLLKHRGKRDSNGQQGSEVGSEAAAQLVTASATRLDLELFELPLGSQDDVAIPEVG
jgi:hypothetical protein